ncbi:MAG: IS66 family transposase [Fimbriimonadaceae bacterium]|nr:IS66 family transposase [Fimbriimonadaceae bacterium]
MSKFVDHLPLYRLEDILLRHGVSLSRSTLCDWVCNAAAALAPLAEFQRKRVLVWEAERLRVNTHPASRIAELLPDDWKPAPQ